MHFQPSKLDTLTAKYNFLRSYWFGSRKGFQGLGQDRYFVYLCLDSLYPLYCDLAYISMSYLNTSRLGRLDYREAKNSFDLLLLLLK
jgi:hypothetical protein